MLRSGARRDAIVGSKGDPVIRVSGQVLDGGGIGVPDAVIEVWSGDGFARVGTDNGGHFEFTTPKPKPVPFDDNTMQSPHLSVAVFARGLLNHLWTRIYFADDESTDTDPILRRVPEARRATLMAEPDTHAGRTRPYSFDIRLQGARETVFFDFRPSSR